MKLGVTINRGMNTNSCALEEMFEGFRNVGAVREIFGDRTDEVLKKTKVVLQSRKGYLHVDDANGNIVISASYLKSGATKHIYLDVIHELVHVRQYMEGKDLFDEKYSYVDRPTEIEAYSVSVKEAKRIGMSHDEIIDYLRVEWVTEDGFGRMLTHLGLRSESS